ncbi:MULTISPECIES: helix-turn-helix transcriptional regulator [Oribacterium]|jgi:possible transcriptional regulator|uniref:Transcriptional regulator n=1 Tax=Oribacterium sinus TaxID=237576 RepID=A0A7W9SI19_9FIRM|nr:helix-turn-helix transcriptional regulator [Oribacterium sinus]MBB6042342.1 putative transcriptional regulator YheO [Oribacterium sinus]MBF1272388.1 transcriptional regulator [Oribacterium sinus]MBF1304890.1 transcriptional regulator [Oribacterium sinus]
MTEDSSLEMLVSTAHGIARQFGKDCEVCIHDLSVKDLEHTIIFIINGHVSGRKIGDGASKVVLETLEAIEKGDIIVDHLGYRTTTQDGRILKSSTVFLKDSTGKYRWVLGINYDVTALMNVDAALQSITTVESHDSNGDGQIPLNVNDLLDNLINQSVKRIGKPPALMNKEEKIQAIQFLRDAGAFLITKSGDKVSNFYGISKFTLYSYIDQSKK